MIRRLVCAFAFGIGLFAAGISPAGAAGDAPGTPGESNCHGQSLAFVAHGGFGGEQGAGNAAKFLGISVKEGQQITRDFCG